MRLFFKEMSGDEKKKTGLGKTLKFASSMKTGITLLAVSVAGLMIGSALSLPIADEPTFQALLILLLINMTLCVYRQVRGLMQAICAGKRDSLLRMCALLCLHVGLIVVIIGGWISFFCGYKGYLALYPGETAAFSDVREEASGTLTLDDFHLDLNEDGSISQYHAAVTLRGENGEEKNAVICVNHPARFENKSILYSEFMYGINVDVLDAEGRMATYVLAEGEYLSLDGDVCGILIHQFAPDYARDGALRSSYAPNDPQIVFETIAPGEPDALRRIGLHDWTQVSKSRWIRFSSVSYYVQLIVKHDPGIFIVTAGSFMLLFGLGALYFGRRIRRPLS